jgi:8-oxo-dGTP pyrophosphatase MutT (NUDIX family)
VPNLERTAPRPARRVPKDSSTLIIVDRSGPVPRILMGRRRPDLTFLPNKFVFPGGRVDPADGSAPSADELAINEIESLLLGMRGRPSRHRARALAIAALRETLEETGIAIGEPPTPTTAFQPRLSAISYFARAVTPPGRPRRYDARFFMCDATTISAQGHPTDGELSGVDWFSLDAMRNLELPNITRLIVEDIAHAVLTPPLAKPFTIPFYYYRHGRTRRDQLCLATLRAP